MVRWIGFQFLENVVEAWFNFFLIIFLIGINGVVCCICYMTNAGMYLKLCGCDLFKVCTM